MFGFGVPKAANPQKMFTKGLWPYFAPSVAHAHDRIAISENTQIKT